MTLIEGVGDELIYATLFAVPIVIIFRSSLRLYTLHFLNQSFSTVGNWLGSISNIMWSRNTTVAVPEISRGTNEETFLPPENDCCSICHDSFSFPCQTNCAHWFCGGCILRVWQHTSALQPCRCPICRRPINLLMPSGFDRSSNPDARRVLQEVANYNRVHGGGPVGIIQRLRDMPLLLQRMVQDLMDPQRALPLVHRTRIIIYLLLLTLYVFSPLDILPEGIFGIVGLLDDVLVMLLVLFHLAAIYRSALIYQYGSNG